VFELMMDFQTWDFPKVSKIDFLFCFPAIIVI
jgi:hypothetical protein